MDFIAAGMVEMIGGVASAVILARYAWWAAILLAGAWLATHWLLRESAIWHDRNTEEVRGAQRDADYASIGSPDLPQARELRLFGLAGWTIDRSHRPTDSTAPASVCSHPSARASCYLEHVDRHLREHRGVLAIGKCRR